MSAPGRYWPDSDRSRVLDWLRDHDGMHSAETVGAAVFPGHDRATHKAAVALRGLWERGDALRSDPAGFVGGAGLRRGLYCAAPRSKGYLRLAPDQVENVGADR